MSPSIDTPVAADDAIPPVANPARPAPGRARRQGQVRAARVAGWGYVALFVLAIFANFTVIERLVVDDDPAATVANIEGSFGWFRLGLLAFLAVFVIDIAVAWALHILFRGHDAPRSLLAAWSRLIYTVFLGVAVIFLFQVRHLVDGGPAVDGFDRAQVEAQVAMAIDSFDATWLVGLAVFGLHLVLVGSLILTSRAAPRLLGLVLVVAGSAYVIDTVCRALLADYDSVASLLLAVVAIPSVIGEGWFGLWLLLRAGRAPALAGTGIASPSPGDRN